MSQSNNRSLVSASAIMAAGTMLSRILGFARAFLIAIVLGNGTRQVEMFSIANTIPTSLYILFAGGALNTVLVPQIVRATKNDADEGVAYTNRIMTAFLAILAAITLIVSLGAPLIIRIYSSDDWRSPALSAQYESMVTLAYLCLPQVFFYGAFFLAGQVLNARGRFGPMMWAPIANNLVSIAILGGYLLIWGTSGSRAAPFTHTQELVLGGGATLGIVIQAAILIPFLRAAGFRYRPRFDFRNTGLGHTFSLAKWTLGFVAANQLVLVIVTRLASSATTGGSGAGITAYNNAYLLWILPHSLITISLATAMLPSASRMAAAGDLHGVGRETTNTIKLATSLLLPASIAFLVLADPISRLAFGNGNGALDYRFISWALFAFAIGLVPFTIQYVCLRAFYALEDTRSTFLLQLAIAAINAGLALLFVFTINRPGLVAAGLALAYSLSYVIGVLISFRLLKKHLPTLNGATVCRHLVRVGLAIAPGIIVAWGIVALLGRWSDSRPVLALSLVVATVSAVGLYVVMARVLHIGEVTDIVGVIRRRGGGKGQRGAKPTEADEDAQLAELTDETQAMTGLDAPHLSHTGPSRTNPPQTDPSQTNEHRQGEPAEGEEAAVDPNAERDRGRTDDDTQRFDPYADDEQTNPGGLAPGAPEAEAHHDEAAEGAGSPTSASAPSAAHTGEVLAGRYRLDEVVAHRGNTYTWRAFDQVLSRAVLCHVLQSTDPRTQNLVEAARRSAIATDSRFLRVLDAVQSTEEGVGSYIVCEYAPGQSVEVLLSQGPLSSLEAAWLTRELADALSAMHAQGLYHQRINPDTVVITPAGNVKIVGFLLEAVMYPEEQPPSDVEPEQVDVQDLGRMLYATLVSRWPGQEAFGLAKAPSEGGRLLTPRQVRAGVSPALDRICEQILADSMRHNEPRLRSAADVVDALSKVLGTADAAHDLERRVKNPVPLAGSDPGSVSETIQLERRRRERFAEPGHHGASTGNDELDDTANEDAVDADGTGSYDAHHSTGRRSSNPSAPPRPVSELGTTRPESNRRWLLILLGVLALAVLLGLFGVAFRQGFGTLGDAPQKFASPTASVTPGPVKIVTGTEFDPEGDDGTENTDQVPRAYDGDPATKWETVTYRGNSKFGNLKDGVGLIVDLGETRDVRTVTLQLDAGADLEIRVPAEGNPSEPPKDSADQWRVVASEKKAGKDTEIVLEKPVASRFVMVYFTNLPAAPGGYQGGIYEVVVGQ